MRVCVLLLLGITASWSMPRYNEAEDPRNLVEVVTEPEAEENAVAEIGPVVEAGPNVAFNPVLDPGPATGTEPILKMSDPASLKNALEYQMELFKKRPGLKWLARHPQLIAHYAESEDSPKAPTAINRDWLNQEIGRINQIVEDDGPYDIVLAPLTPYEPYWQRLEPKKKGDSPIFIPHFEELPGLKNYKPMPEPKPEDVNRDDPAKPSDDDDVVYYNDDEKVMFALTPYDDGYYEIQDKNEDGTAGKTFSKFQMLQESVKKIPGLIDTPRETRQNPNLSRTKTLVAENVNKLRTGFTPEDGEMTAIPRHIHVVETAVAEPPESIFGFALVAAVGAALTVALFGFVFGWYTLTTRAKAAADVDYPAYGVTGPNADPNGDRKLAQSAHMYHYQHQKQQIIAMEKNALDVRTGSVSDPDSEEENAEGDYTVYEWPGFATTGDMEVKNPLFSEESTPASAAKCEVIKPQPKN